MEHKRAKTLEALSTFIQSQKALLSRTERDIDRLRELRGEVVSNKDVALETIFQRVAEHGLQLSEQPGLVNTLHRDIEWSLFRSSDPASLRKFGTSLRHTHAGRAQPSRTQTSELSELQKLVKEARSQLVDPILQSFSFLNEPLSDADEEPPDPEEVRRALERDKIRELKKRKINSAALVPVFAGLRRPLSKGVFVRLDQADESAEVDISLDDGRDDGVSTARSESEVVPMDVDTPATSVESPASFYPGLPPVDPLPPKSAARERRVPRKAQARGSTSALSDSTQRNRGRGSLAKVEPKAEEEDTPASTEVVPEDEPAQDSKQKSMAKSETYKQAWSVSEQHLLERLLEEIPEGEKNRWAKISKAMNGRRTPRQVASRVQKYFEKLKRFGVEIGGGKSTA
ncbi:hypothetical protein IEO21_04712 [Rhodonia placenta]|uniref:Myb-like domain-containing protein n=1 Tax=Rhodonia placenta TaxID=104341 RepID=A0A8H7P390_9APHY|nr:hypothetical protein IEO21_04712 [Postia placenta]